MDILEKLAAELERVESRLNRDAKSKGKDSKKDVVRAKQRLEAAEGHLTFIRSCTESDCERTIAQYLKSLERLEKERRIIESRIIYYQEFAAKKEELESVAKQSVVEAKRRLAVLTGREESPETKEQRAKVTLEAITKQIAASPELAEKLRQIKELSDAS